jgi:hypothetical protein
MKENPAVTGRPERVLALYAVVAYALVLAIPRELSMPTMLPLGRFTLEGQAAVVVYLMWLALWIIAAGGMAWRRVWGYRLGLVVFGLHIVLFISNCLRWLADNHAPLRMALGAAVWPTLQFVVADILAMACLWERRAIFSRGRGLQAALDGARGSYERVLGIGESQNE